MSRQRTALLVTALIVPRASDASAYLAGLTLADISDAEGRQLSYQYQQKTSELDGVFDCLHYHFRSGVELTAAEERVPALAMDFELRQWQAAQSFLVSREERRSYLDVGCGMGRVIDRLGGLFETVTCVEADATRIAKARHAKTWGATRDVRFANSRFEEWEAPQGIKYDAITSIHVFQHIPTELPLVWLRKAKALLAPGGVIFVVTTHALQHRLSFSNGQTVKKLAFNERARGNGEADGLLAVQYFTQRGLKALFEEAGLHVLMQEQLGFAKDAHGAPVGFSQFIAAGLAPTPLPTLVRPATLMITPWVRAEFARIRAARTRCGGSDHPQPGGGGAGPGGGGLPTLPKGPSVRPHGGFGGPYHRAGSGRTRVPENSTALLRILGRSIESFLGRGGG